MASLAALACWDDFHYQEPEDPLKKQARKSPEYEREPLLAASETRSRRISGPQAFPHSLSRVARGAPSRV
jgi:hypothetical protein